MNIICSNCKTEKPDSDFYQDRRKKNGCSSKCISCYEYINCSKCNIEKHKSKFRDDIKKVNGKRSICLDCDAVTRKKRQTKEYNQDNYIRNKDNMNKHSAYWRKKNKDRYNDLIQKNRFKYPEKIKARNASYRCKLNGYHAHHWSYNIWDAKNVIFLKPKDHAIVHREIIYCQDSFYYKNKDGELLDTIDKHLLVIKSLGIDYILNTLSIELT